MFETKGSSSSSAFWGEVAPCDHFVQVYGNDEVFLDMLAGFVGGGLRTGDAAIVIATASHRRELDRRLSAAGRDLASARRSDQYVAVDAELALEKFMVKGWPDEARFRAMVDDLLRRARGDGRRVRAFGEMVALLWAEGHHGATMRLEQIWTELCKVEGFSLFCAYPRLGLTYPDLRQSLHGLCSTHSRVLMA